MLMTRKCVVTDSRLQVSVCTDNADSGRVLGDGNTLGSQSSARFMGLLAVEALHVMRA